jgi:hypothetical protein
LLLRRYSAATVTSDATFCSPLSEELRGSQNPTVPLAQAYQPAQQLITHVTVVTGMTLSTKWKNLLCIHTRGAWSHTCDRDESCVFLLYKQYS